MKWEGYCDSWLWPITTIIIQSKRKTTMIVYDASPCQGSKPELFNTKRGNAVTLRSSVTFSRTHEHAIHLICLSKLNAECQDQGIKIFYRRFKAMGVYRTNSNGHQI
jgi:hypothetical protein